MRKITLLIPNTRWQGGRIWVYPPSVAAIMTAILKEKFDFSIVDACGKDLSEDECVEALKKMSPDLICVTGSSVEQHSSTHIATDCAKKACPSVPVVLGGVYPTTLPEVAIEDKNVDWLFMYHAEERAARFFQAVLSGNSSEVKNIPGVGWRGESGQLEMNALNERIGDCQEMVTPDYTLLDLNPYLFQKTPDYQANAYEPTAYILTSYGCPYNCVFCASRSVSGRKVAMRSVESVVSEVEYLMNNYGVTQLVIADDALLTDKGRAARLFDFFKSAGLRWKVGTIAAWDLNPEILLRMKNSGCDQISISVESGCLRVLKDIIHKPLKLEIVPPLVQECHRLGIDVGGNIVIGFPGETWDEIRESIEFGEKCDFDVLHFHIATPLPQTELYKICCEENLLPEDFSFTDPKFFGYCQGFISTKDFTPQELQILRAYEWDRINFSTPEKRERMCKLYKLTPEQLDEHRRKTRQNLGVYHPSQTERKER